MNPPLLDSSFAPCPSRLIVWGLPGALSGTLMAAARSPELPGEKVTLKVHAPAGARVWLEQASELRL